MIYFGRVKITSPLRHAKIYLTRIHK